MALWKPDPTFYPSPKMAMQAPPENLAYVAVVNAKKNGRPDALGVVDVDDDIIFGVARVELSERFAGDLLVLSDARK